MTFLIGIISIGAYAQKYSSSERPKNLEEQLNDEYCTGLFNSADGLIFDIASSNNAFGYLNILDWLQGRIAGLQVYKTRNGLSVPYLRGTLAGVYFNEMPVSLSFLESINNFDIAIIKVIKSPFLGGFNGSGGAIAIYSIGGEENGEDEIESK